MDPIQPTGHPQLIPPTVAFPQGVKNIPQVDANMSAKNLSKQLLHFGSEHALEKDKLKIPTPANPLDSFAIQLSKLLEAPFQEDVYYKEFEILQKLTTYNVEFRANCGLQYPDIKGKNRHSIPPYQHNRFVLPPQGQVPDEPQDHPDYINASWIKVGQGNVRQNFIATEAPLPRAFENFWHMVFTSKSELIVMLTDETQRGQADVYWPEDSSIPLELKNYQITLDTEDLSNENDIFRIFRIKDLISEKEREIKFHQFKYWPDMQAMKSEKEIIDFLGFNEAVNNEINQLPEGSPVIIHCSAGIGRTGAFLVIHHTINEVQQAIAQKKSFDNIHINLMQKTSNLRRQRHQMVYTPSQYAFCYRAVIASLKKNDS